MAPRFEKFTTPHQQNQVLAQTKPNLLFKSGVKWLDDCTFAEAIETLAGESTERPQIKPQERVADPDKYERQQAAKARWLWRQRCPIAGSPAERYLRERRYAGPPPATLPARPRRTPACDDRGVRSLRRARARNCRRTTGLNAVHLTLLKPDGSGKADTKPNKLIVGRPLSRPIVLAPPNDLLGLVITEGIEDALSVHEATGLGAWAAGSASFIPALADAVPPYVECLTVCVDDDPTGRKHASELVRRLRDRGFEVIPRLLRSPEAAA